MTREVNPVTLMAKMVWAMRVGSYVLAGYAFLQSVAILVGGPERFSAPGYNVAMWVPGAPPTWGWALLPFALGALVGIRMGLYRLVEWCMYGLGVWSMFFCISFAWSALTVPDANFTAIMVYGKDALLFLLVGVAYRGIYKERALLSG